MSAVFQAKYPGRCADCGERIEAGDAVRYVDDELVHDACTATSPPPRTPPVCATCWLAHAGECF